LASLRKQKMKTKRPKAKTKAPLAETWGKTKVFQDVDRGGGAIPIKKVRKIMRLQKVVCTPRNNSNVTAMLNVVGK